MSKKILGTLFHMRSQKKGGVDPLMGRREGKGKAFDEESVSRNSFLGIPSDNGRPDA
jgi:hypothetical protein